MKFTPYPYQQIAVDKAVAFFRSERATKPKLLVAPTAAGKSFIIACIANELKERVLIFQPSLELLEQNFEKFQQFSDNAEVYSAGKKSKKIGAVTYATIGSVVKVAHLFADFKYLIIDEAHLYPPGSESMFGQFLKANPQLKILGLTATPFRLHSGMGGSKLVMMHNSNIYNGYCHIIQIQEIAPKYWCPIKYMQDVGQQHILKVNSSGAEYTEESLALYGSAIEDRIMHHVNVCQGYPKIVFVPTIQQAQALAAQTPKAAAVSAKTPAKERKQLIEQFKRGYIETVFNVNLLSVGFDYPGLKIIIDAVPTMSLARYYQKIGRLTRRHPEKRIGGCIDLAGNFTKFGRVEDLEIRATGSSYHVFSGDRKLTGVWFGEAYQPPAKPLPAVFEDREIRFGKFKGKKISETPPWYLSWILDNVDQDKDLLGHVELHLRSLTAAQRT